MPADNKQVFVACEARTMKTPLNETGQIHAPFFSMGITIYKVDFQVFLRVLLNLLLLQK